MSILSDYEEIKKDIGEEKWNAIDKYIEFQRPDLRLDQIIYYPDNWMAFEKWFYEEKGKNIEVMDVWNYEIDEYRASVEIWDGKDNLGSIIVSYTEKDIRNLTGNINKELSNEQKRNAIAVLALRDFDTYRNLPKVSEVSNLLREIYNIVKESNDRMCFISYDEWNESFERNYTEKDIENLKKEIEKYKISDCIELDKDDCKVIGYADIERAFIDDRKEPIKKITTLDYLDECRDMVEHNIYCYSILRDGIYVPKSGYEKFWALEYEKLRIIDDLIKNEKTKSKINDNEIIIKTGVRDNIPIALIEKKLEDNRKEYIIAFFYEIDNKKVKWNYGYNYMEDIKNVEKDFYRVLNNEDLNNIFEDSYKEVNNVRMNFYNEKEIETLIKSGEKILYVEEDKCTSAYIREKDLADFIVYLNRENGVTDLCIYELDSSIFTPDIITKGTTLQKVTPEFKEKIGERLEKLKRQEIMPKKFKIIDKEMYEEIEKKIKNQQKEKSKRSRER